MVRTQAIIHIGIGIIWAGTFGAIAGPVCKIIGLIEDLVAESKSDIRMWRRYPKMQTIFYLRNYIQTLKLNRAPATDVTRLMARYREGTLSPPHPIIQIGISVIFTILRLPGALISGMVEGPMVVWDDWRRRHPIMTLHPKSEVRP